MARLRAERGRVDIERTGADVAIYNTDGLVSEPEKIFPVEFLLSQLSVEIMAAGFTSEGLPACV